MYKNLFFTCSLLLMSSLSLFAFTSSADVAGPPWEELYEAETVEKAMFLEDAPDGHGILFWSTDLNLSQEEIDKIDSYDPGGVSMGVQAFAQHQAGDWTFLFLRFSGSSEITYYVAIMSEEGRVVATFEHKRSHANRYGETSTETTVLSEGEVLEFLTLSTSKSFDENGNTVEESSQVVSRSFDTKTGELEVLEID